MKKKIFFFELGQSASCPVSKASPAIWAQTQMAETKLNKNYSHRKKKRKKKKHGF
jgi:hypothetical protein